MKTKKPFIYLASQSARRKGILGKMRIPFRVVPSRYREHTSKRTSPAAVVMRHAEGKARMAVLPKNARFVLGADTLVYCGGKIFEKPKNWTEAYRMLGLLSGKSHRVYTGVVLRDRRNKKTVKGISETTVFFRKLTVKKIKHYYKSVNPFDKAGGYAIQKGPRIVRRIIGSYTNVVGLPVELLKALIEDIMNLSRQKRVRLRNE